jgi:F0F1-type ATP synthase membrane subunit c/vacuolar-type H+-ATPase subunit K
MFYIYIYIIISFTGGISAVLLLTAVKYIVVGFSMLPISFAALGTGLLFGTYNLAVAQNPEETENIFNTTLMGFALVETFVFLSFAVAALIFFV